MTSDTTKEKEAEKKLGKMYLQFYRACDLSEFVQILGDIFVKEEEIFSSVSSCENLRWCYFFLIRQLNVASGILKSVS